MESVLMDTSWICLHRAMMGTPVPEILGNLHELSSFNPHKNHLKSSIINIFVLQVREQAYRENLTCPSSYTENLGLKAELLSFA